MVAAQYGWGDGEFACLDTLWEQRVRLGRHAQNPSSGAYGIPQALPGSKMAAYGGDWRTTRPPRSSGAWATSSGRYGTPCGAWSHSQGWY